MRFPSFSCVIVYDRYQTDTPHKSNTSKPKSLSSTNNLHRSETIHKPKLSVCQERGSQEVLAKHTRSVNRWGLMPGAHTLIHRLTLSPVHIIQTQNTNIWPHTQMCPHAQAGSTLHPQRDSHKHKWACSCTLMCGYSLRNRKKIFGANKQADAPRRCLTAGCLRCPQRCLNLRGKRVSLVLAVSPSNTPEACHVDLSPYTSKV